MSNQNDLRGRVCDILQRVKYVELGGSLYPLADEIIALVRADERRRIREAIDAEYEKVMGANTDIMGGYDMETAGMLQGFSAAAGLTEDER